MPRSLADGHTKLTILLDEPSNPAVPTAAELNAGIDASCNVLGSDFVFGPTDSDKTQEKALCTVNNANSLSASNFQAGITVFRYFDATTGAVDPSEDAVFQALKTKGTTAWVYARRNGKLAPAAWAAADDIFFGAEVITDEAQPPSDLGGFIKNRIPMEPQNGWPNTVAG